jgi:hypothetical protein
MFAKGLHMIPILLVTALLAPAAQSAKPKTPVEPLKLIGCMSTKPGTNGDYTFTTEAGVKYRLTGKDSRKYGGKKVEITQNDAKGLRVRGGLYPSPNIAAQAGGLDPLQAAIAAQPGGGAAAGTGTDLPEFRAARVRAIEGACQ